MDLFELNSFSILSTLTDEGKTEQPAEETQQEEKAQQEEETQQEKKTKRKEGTAPFASPVPQKKHKGKPDATSLESTRRHRSSFPPSPTTPFLLKQLSGKRDRKHESTIQRTLPAGTPIKYEFSQQMQQMQSAVPEQYRNKVLLVMVMHALPTMVFLLRKIKELGITNIIFHPKPYSTVRDTEDLQILAAIQALGIQVIQPTIPTKYGIFGQTFKQDMAKLANIVLDKIAQINPDNKDEHFKLIPFDDGGEFLLTISKEVKFRPFDSKTFAIEKTTRGSRKLDLEGLPPSKAAKHPLPIVPFPWICLPHCFLKEQESPIIAKSILDKIVALLPITQPPSSIRCGIIGFGSIGKALATTLHEQGYEVYVYDENPEVQRQFPLFVKACPSLIDLINQAQYIIGCTGKNTLKPLFQSLIPSNPLPWSFRENKIWMSGSSGDVEFKALLSHLQAQREAQGDKAPIDFLADIIFPCGQFTLTLLRGGCPINLDGTLASDPPEIVITRTMAYSAIYTWLAHKPENIQRDLKTNKVKLDEAVQQYIWNLYKKYLTDCSQSLKTPTLEITAAAAAPSTILEFPSPLQRSQGHFMESIPFDLETDEEDEKDSSESVTTVTTAPSCDIQF